jgi:dTDP-4-dehydrorhamnose 3,5-epimerase
VCKILQHIAKLDVIFALMPLKIINTSIEGLLLVRPNRFTDERGYFSETFSQRDFNAAVGGEVEFVQDNESLSAKGVLRGMHFQVPPAPMGKLVRVVSGAILDVAVDIRKGSLTYGKHEAVRLDADEGWQFWIPEGFAHGFLALEEGTKIAYKCTAFYDPECDSGIRCDNLGIDWGIDNPLVSAKDKCAISLDDFDSPF